MFGALSKTFHLNIWLSSCTCCQNWWLFPLCFLTLLATVVLLPVMTLPGVQAQISCSQVIVWWHCEGALAGHFTRAFCVLLFPFFSCIVYIEFSPNLTCFLGFLSIPTVSPGPLPWRPVVVQSCPTWGDALSMCFEGLVCIVFYSKGRLGFRKLLSSCYLSPQGSIIALSCSLPQVPALWSLFLIFNIERISTISLMLILMNSIRYTTFLDKQKCVYSRLSFRT